ncbi:MAG: transcriptional regulator, Crp/Fnr family [Crocinitomicaceae bacterium]|jgi:CRP/FNR family transcriptional regulator|nr:transcriptional regulator, Crp/Fnr family [Crocinitomicaceae bacterium]
MNSNHKHITCANCLSRKSSLFSTFSDSQVEDLNHHKSCAFYAKNQPVFLEDNLPRGVFCLNSGKVKVFKRGSEGKEQIIHIAVAGEILGYKAMFSGDLYKVSATTLEESNICFISKEDFLNMLDSNTTLRNNILKELSIELGERAVSITNMAQKSVRERLAFALLMLDSIYKEEAINLSREDLANFVGTATENLIRLLKELKEEGCIEIHVRKIEVLDKEKLLRISGK